MSEKKTKILIVDDDDLTREMYAEVFSKVGYEVLQAKDGVEGLDIATKEMPDVIFTGIVMPRMDGFSMLESLQKTVMTAKIPVVISSHMGREEDQQRANTLGAKDFIVRGLTPPNSVVERIEKLLAKGGSYTLEFDPYAMDAQKMAEDLKISSNFHCIKCNTKLVEKVQLEDVREKQFSATFVCPNCGWTAR